MVDPDKKGMELMAEAEKKMTSSKGFFTSVFGGGDSKTIDAIECYQRAANVFKMARNWTKAGEAFQKAADLHMALQNKHDAASHLVDAANCYKKENVKLAVTCLEKAIEHYLEMGRFQLAAKHHQSIGEFLEADGDIPKAMHHYEKAADFYKGEDSTAYANKNMLKVASHAAMLEDYTKAVRIYEEIATSCLENSLLKLSAKEYFFQASVCHLCVDVLNCQQALDRYKEMYPAFQDTIQFKLMKDLAACVENEDVDGFTEALQDYDANTRLENWYTTLFLRVKKSLNTEGDLL